MSHQRVRAIIERSNRIVMIERKKDSKHYYVFPGGGVEDGEGLEEALKRECLEETNVQVDVHNILYLLDEGDNRQQLFYFCSFREGVVGPGDGPEYNGEGSHCGFYRPQEVEIDLLEGLKIYPNCIAKRLIMDLKKYGCLRDIPLQRLSRK